MTCKQFVCMLIYSKISQTDFQMVGTFVYNTIVNLSLNLSYLVELTRDKVVCLKSA